MLHFRKECKDLAGFTGYEGYSIACFYSISEDRVGMCSIHEVTLFPGAVTNSRVLLSYLSLQKLDKTLKGSSSVIIPEWILLCGYQGSHNHENGFQWLQHVLWILLSFHANERKTKIKCYQNISEENTAEICHFPCCDPETTVKIGKYTQRIQMGIQNSLLWFQRLGFDPAWSPSQTLKYLL